MDSEADTLIDSGSATVATVKTVVEDNVDQITGLANSSNSVMDYIVAVRVAVQDLYFSEDIEVRLCWWLSYCLVVLCLSIILAWKTYGREIMTVLACQDRLTRSGSMSGGSSRQSSAEGTPVVTEPKTSRESWRLPGRPIESSISEPHHHPKTD